MLKVIEIAAVIVVGAVVLEVVLIWAWKKAIEGGHW